jgi:hypothetical protein
MVRSRSPEAERRGPVEIVVPRGGFLALDEPRRGFLERLFGPAMPRFRLSWETDGAAGSAIFSVSDTREFLGALRKAIPADRA